MKFSEDFYISTHGSLETSLKNTLKNHLPYLCDADCFLKRVYLRENNFLSLERKSDTKNDIIYFRSHKIRGNGRFLLELKNY